MRSSGHHVAEELPTVESHWRVRAASQADVAGIVDGISHLLGELGGKTPAASEMEKATRILLEDPDAGNVIVADAQGRVIGLLACSWQAAIHVPGPYALIQDLWVHEDWRGQAVGAALTSALLEESSKRGITRVEVGLPMDKFAGIRATEAFYIANGFEALGSRMRLTLR